MSAPSSSIPPMREIEHAEVQAWLDMYAAVPAEFRERFNPEIVQVDGVTLTRCRAIPFSHFRFVHLHRRQGRPGINNPGGNTSAASVLRVMFRTFQTPPAW